MKYISILRGINVAGQKKITMEALKTLYKVLGFHAVSTYIQSGNVIFCGTKVGQIKTATEKAISKSFFGTIKNIENIYGDGKSSQRALKILKDLKFDDLLYKTEDPLDIPL